LNGFRLAPTAPGYPGCCGNEDDTLERLEALADLVIRRALGFASLAIGLIFLSLSFQWALVLRSGAMLVTLL